MSFAQREQIYQDFLPFLHPPSSFVPHSFQLIFVWVTLFFDRDCIFFPFLQLVGYKEEEVTGLK